jgi:AcrR family transcriptional regulator
MSARVKTKQSVVAEFRSQEILKAARKLFARKGLAGTTMDEIAQEAGLAKGTLYLYFASKHEIYLKELQLGAECLFEQTQKEVEAATGLRAKIHAFIYARLRFAEENRDFYQIYFQEFSHQQHPEEISRECRNLDRRRTTALGAVLREAHQSGEVRPLREALAASLIHDMTRSLILRRLKNDSKSSIEEDSDFLCDFIIKGIGNRFIKE